jgi:hypothetical protein
LGSSEGTKQRDFYGTSRRETEEWKALNLSVKAANLPKFAKWAQRSQKSMGEFGCTIKDGAGMKFA